MDSANQKSPNALMVWVANIVRQIEHKLSEPARVVSLALLGFVVLASGSLGYLLGQRANQSSLITIPASFNTAEAQSSERILATDTSTDVIEPTSGGPANLNESATLATLGRMRAELLRLHALFSYLADIAELNTGEFDLESPMLEWDETSASDAMGLLNRRMAHISKESSIMAGIFNARRQIHTQRISGLPLVNGARSSGFGIRVDPITGARNEHLGLDFSGPVGEPILALADGVVSYSGKNAGYGNLVELEHVDGLRTRYAHNDSLLVSRGDRVEKGQKIATLGSTGRSTGPHLHLEVRLNGLPVDPAIFIR